MSSEATSPPVSTGPTVISVSSLTKDNLLKPPITLSRNVKSRKDQPQVSDDDENDETQDSPPISSEHLLRRASFKKILEDLSSSADTLNKSVTDPLVSAAVQVQQAAVLQQAGLTNPALLPILHNLQQNVQSGTTLPPSSTDLTQQLAAAMMLPNQLNTQQQLQTALLNTSQSPLIAGAASLASHQLPTNLLSSALLNAASLTSNPFSNLGLQLAASPLASAGLNKVSSVRNDISPSQLSVGNGGGNDEPTRKKEVRLMKNREAARECRRKKKEYIRCLENRVAVLESQNQALIGELRALKELYLPKNQE